MVVKDERRLTFNGENIMETMITGNAIDLSLNRSLEELVSSYFEADGAGIELDENTRPEELDDYYVLENYLADMGAI